MAYTPPATKPMGTAPNALKTAPSAVPDPIAQMSKAKNEGMALANERNARATALTAALAMVTAYTQACIASGAMNGLKESEVKDWLRGIKSSEYATNCKLVGVEPEIEF